MLLLLALNMVVSPPCGLKPVGLGGHLMVKAPFFFFPSFVKYFILHNLQGCYFAPALTFGFSSSLSERLCESIGSPPQLLHQHFGQ